MKPTDRFIVATENNIFHDCYSPDFRLNQTSSKGVSAGAFGGKIVLQWGFCSQAQHPFLSQVLTNIADLVQRLYTASPYLSADLTAPFFSLICTTGPGVFTASILEALEKQPDLPYRWAGDDFIEYGGRFKANNEMWNKSPNHYSRKVNKGEKLLISFSSSNSSKI